MSSNLNWLRDLDSSTSLLGQENLSTYGSTYASMAALGSISPLRDAFRAIAPIPEWPSGWSSGYLQSIEKRLNRRAYSLEDRIEAMTLGRVIPDIDQVSIGSGKHMHLAVMFLDICKFSSWPSGSHDEQSKVLRVMNIFMAEMLNIIRDFGGTFEKNTGDGLMAYFGATNSQLVEASRTAVLVASIMKYVNDYVLTPWFTSNNLWPVRFRVGIDAGEVTLAKVGIPCLAEQLVAIGSTANIACKIMRLLDEGGICIGNNVKNNLSVSWQYHTKLLGETNFVYVQSQEPYRAWEVTHKLSKPYL